ncbi:Reticulon-like protein B2 [Forsythia ovata]|uniref:Reticulon-like protein n=1 Tax=Forsythia ovata TaxID=205694 RepID=A0ABD1W3N0_9LAMI
MPPKQPSKTNGNSRLFGKPVHSVLGGGKIADILLWKKYKLSGGVLGGATIIWILLQLVGYHVLTIVSRGLIVALGAMFIWSWGAIFIKKTPPKIPALIIPEEPVLKLVSALRIQINRSLASLNDAASGKDLKKFLWVVSKLAFVSVLGGWFDFLTMLYLATVLLFTVLLFYDKYKNRADSFLVQLMAKIKKYYEVADAKVVSKIPTGESRN